MNRIQDVAAWLPYMTCVGNHGKIQRKPPESLSHLAPFVGHRVVEREVGVLLRTGVELLESPASLFFK